jgi:hypothetical protein
MSQNLNQYILDDLQLLYFNKILAGILFRFFAVRFFLFMYDVLIRNKRFRNYVQHKYNKQYAR